MKKIYLDHIAATPLSLTSLGLPANIAQGGIVMSLGKETTQEEIDMEVATETNHPNPAVGVPTRSRRSDLLNQGGENDCLQGYT